MSSTVDVQRLSRWLDSQHVVGEGELAELSQLAGGSQNALYVIQRGGSRMVMRMPGERADDKRLNELRREIRLVRALAGTDVPHAELIAADESGEVFGKPFYVMAEVDGWSPMDGGWAPPFDTDLEARRGLAFQLIEGAAKLARVDWRGQGLEGFGRPEGFHDRQVDRWLSFLKGFQVRDLPGLDVATEWLQANRPEHFTPGIMHGDYQFANVMYAHGSPARLAALVDWEMTTIGDPLLDLAWAVLGYDGDEPKTDFYLPMEGMPPRSDLLEHYEKISGLPTDNLDYYLVLANFKIGVVLERTYARNVASPDGDREVAEAFGTMVLQSIATAADMARSLAGSVG
ncbi:acyl-CoA dehydrogenase [Mycolicibacterium tusciae]|uniref:Acyl-CoA dehydrogenase n=1 Tax=Mycolicibacterium tusciae TaxID=75922 RepID=A0A1X0JTK2_9MYCO|nr:phosphotransferase family protein [Mycolicibacterium tusciae]ORB65547.1 acyl-CoA dehydrogenase [Mycolicibacterium tusciae]